jgi:hypothetical protein
VNYSNCISLGLHLGANHGLLADLEKRPCLIELKSEGLGREGGAFPARDIAAGPFVITAGPPAPGLS